MSTSKPKGVHAGIVVKHRATCASLRAEPKRCNCRRTYQAAVWSARDRKRIRKHFDKLEEAQAWRDETRGKLRRRELRAPSPLTLTQAAEAWLAGVRDGSIRTRSGDLYKPSAVRSYELALRGPQGGSGGLLRDFGAMKLSEVDQEDLEGYVGRLTAQGLKPSTVRNAIMPLRAIYRWKSRSVSVNPTAGLELPAVRGARDRIASPAEAELLLAALPAEDRALWATALYAGLRRGELMGLRWGDVDLAAGVLRVERSYDPPGRCMVEPKSRAGRRRVPIAAVLRDHLDEHKLRAGSVDVAALVFSAAGRPFSSSGMMKRARRAWRVAGLDPIGLQEGRHTFASLMIAAGVNAKALSTYMGHSSITITLDRYGHLFPGSEDEAAGLLDAYLAAVREAAADAARRADVAAATSAHAPSLIT